MGADGLLGLRTLLRWFCGKNLASPDHLGHLVEIVLYTRRGCHLCEEAHLLLERVGRKYPLSIKLIDIDTDPELTREHGLHVPVIAVAGKVRFRGVVNPVLLERLLRVESFK